MTKPTDIELLKTKESFMVIEVDYSTKYVLKHSHGLKFLESLNGMECLKDPYKELITIVPLSESYPKTWLISQEKYLEYKMNALLGIDTKLET